LIPLSPLHRAIRLCTFRHRLNAFRIIRKQPCPTENYDALNRPATWSQAGPNGFYKSSHYQYDQANREKATWRDEDGSTGERFEYEASNQLKKVSYSRPAPTPSPTPSATPTPPGGSPTPPNATPTPGQPVNEVTFTQTTGSSGNVLVTMSTTTANAVIFFTYNATGNPPDPTHAGSTAGPGTTRYVAPTSVANGTVRYFKALAYHKGMTDSEITEYNVDNGDGPNAVGRTVIYEYTPDKLNRSSVTDSGVTTLYSANALNLALKAFAEAAHTVQDSFSPPHRDANGNPRVYTHLQGLLEHSPNESGGYETRKDVTPGIAETQKSILREMWKKTFGN
jgi:hypothetical protein